MGRMRRWPTALLALLFLGGAPAATRAGQDQPITLDPAELMSSLEAAREEALREAREAYRAWSAPLVAALTHQWGGEWWVVGFREEGRPDWVRGVLGGDYDLADAEAAIARADLVKDGLKDLLWCCRKSFGAPLVREDRWTYSVVYPQAVGNVLVERALLQVRLLKRYDAIDREKGQWNVEILDVSADLPADLDFRPSVTPDGALAAFGEAKVPPQALTGEPGLLFCRDREGGEPPRLCWQVEDEEHVYRLDALTGVFLPAMDKSRSLW